MVNTDLLDPPEQKTIVLIQNTIAVKTSSIDVLVNEDKVLIKSNLDKDELVGTTLDDDRTLKIEKVMKIF